MKLVILSVFFVAYVSAVSEPVIKNTRAEGCIDGVCASHCDFEGAKIFPGDNLNQLKKCRLLKCSSEFDIRITTCPFDSKLTRNLNFKSDNKNFSLINSAWRIRMG